jgi:methylmalonyl-CoA/ethylmalonyl-CoA epimerase
MPFEESLKGKTDVSLRPLHLGISVPDMDESIAWYTDVLGFSLLSDKYMEPIKARVAFLKHGEFSIELFEIDGAKPLPEERRIPNLDIQTHGTKHMAFAVEHIHEFVDRLKEKNVDIAMDIFPMEEDLVCFIRDNSGNLLELIQTPESQD